MAKKAGDQSAVAPPPPSPPDNEGHNNPPVEAANEAAPAGEVEITPQMQRLALFRHHLAQARADSASLEQAMEVVRGVRKRRNRNRNECRTDGFPLEILDRILRRESMTTADLEAEAEVEGFMLDAAALPVPGYVLKQGELFGVRDENWWKSEGYRRGLNGQDQAYPGEMPPEFRTAFTAGYSSGQEDMAESKKLFQRIADRAKGDEPLLTNPEPEVQPEPEGEPAAAEGEGEETDDAGEAQPETAEADAE